MLANEHLLNSLQLRHLQSQLSEQVRAGLHCCPRKLAWLCCSGLSHKVVPCLCAQGCCMQGCPLLADAEPAGCTWLLVAHLMQRQFVEHSAKLCHSLEVFVAVPDGHVQNGVSC